MAEGKMRFAVPLKSIPSFALLEEMAHFSGMPFCRSWFARP